MSRGRPEKTLADYLVIAVSPALIMLLVGSLVFFLLEITYAGRYESRLQWILFWFVLAAVLIARIAIVQGSEYAGVFGLALAGATSLVIFRFVDAPLIAIALLGLIWWCAHKLTWDCTLIDDEADASGEGLLQVAGLDDREPAPDADNEAEGEPRKKAHAPGVWVIYFSLAALPLFGLGQLMVPLQDQAARTSAFRYLAVYVASAMGLLLLTSFLGLRRYLRQRRLQMPGTMAATWLVFGAVLITAVLAVCIFLPRPEADYSLTAMLDRAASEARQASRVAALRDDSGKGEGQRVGEPDEEDEPPAQDTDDPAAEGEGKAGGQADGDQAGGEQDDQGQQEDQAQQQDGEQQGEDGQANGEQQQNADQGDRGAEQAEAGDDAGAESASSESPAELPDPPFAGGIAEILKWLVYAALVMAAVYLLFRHGSALLAALRRMWQDLLNLLGLGARSAATEDGAATGEPSRPRPFAAFQNPFTNGYAQRVPPAEVVRYTFEAFEAWAAEQGFVRQPDQTPLEFGQALADRIGPASAEIRQLVQLYARTAYGNHSPSRSSLDPLERLWRRMSDATVTA